MIHGDGSPVMFQAPQSLVTDAARGRLFSSRAFMPAPNARALFVPMAALQPRSRTPEPATFVPLPRGRFEEPFPEPVRAPTHGETAQPGAPVPSRSQVATFPIPTLQGFGQESPTTRLRPFLIGGGIVVGLVVLWLIAR